MAQNTHISQEQSTHANNHDRSKKRRSTQVRNAIISAAIDLFQKKGYVSTSLSEIARKVGMDPSSLYYYFPSKQALLETVTHPENLAPSFANLESHSNKAAQQLYALIVHDVVYKCELPIDFIEMEEAAYKTPEEFDFFFKHYKTSYLNIVKVINAGITNKEFNTCSADERAVTILSINEGLQHHYHAKQRNKLILEMSGYATRNYAPEEIGHLSAQSVLPSLITSEVDFQRIADEGMNLYCYLRKQYQYQNE